MNIISKKAHEELLHYGWRQITASVYVHDALPGHTFTITSAGGWRKAVGWEHHDGQQTMRSDGCEQLAYHLMTTHKRQQDSTTNVKKE